jgi:hypothetical protein
MFYKISPLQRAVPNIDAHCPDASFFIENGDRRSAVSIRSTFPSKYDLQQNLQGVVCTIPR